MLRFLIPLVLGIASVAQAGMNRQVGASLGWSTAALLNNTVLFFVSALFYFMSPRTSVPSSGARAAYYGFPGLLGIILVMGIPWAISKWGATPVFVGLIVSQVVSSIIWDAVGSGRGLGVAGLTGVALSLGGALLLTVKT